MKRFHKKVFSFVKFVFLILLPHSVTMDEDGFCRAGDSTSISLLFRTLHKGILISSVLVVVWLFNYIVKYYLHLAIYLTNPRSSKYAYKWKIDVEKFYKKSCRQLYTYIYVMKANHVLLKHYFPVANILISNLPELSYSYIVLKILKLWSLRSTTRQAPRRGNIYKLKKAFWTLITGKTPLN